MKIKSPKIFLAGAIPAIGNQISQTRDTNAGSITTNISNIIYFLFGGIAIIMLILAGIKYISASGPEASKQARSSIVHIILAVVLLTAVYAILLGVITISKYFLTPSA
jgi:hypothetical protein